MSFYSISMKKKQKQQKVKKEFKIEGEAKRVIIVILSVFIFLGLFYLITIKSLNKEEDTSTEEDVTTMQSEEILVGSSFNRAGDEYIVVYYDKSNSDLASSIGNKVYEYRNKEERLPLYEADMSNIFNKNYVTENDVNKNPKDASELMINGPTLIKFAKDKVVDYVQGENEILNYLG